jgi:ribosomal protein S6--L-glutamate ligase
MRIGILGAPDSWYARDFARAAAGFHDVQLRSLPFTRLRASIHSDQQQSAAGEDVLNELSAVVVRSMPPGSLEQVIFRMDVLHSLATRGCVVVNSPRALETAIDKYLTFVRLQGNGFSLPPTIVTQDFEEAMQAFDQLGRDVVVKPIFGSEGRGMIRITDTEIARRVFRSLQLTQAVLYIQEFIPNPGEDLRLLTIGSQVLGMRRICRDNWRANLAQGAIAEPFDVNQELAQTALRAAALIGADVAAIDLLPATNGIIYVLEVNAVPGWRGLARALQVDVTQRVLDLICQRVRST